MATDELKPKQRKFVEEYLTDLNATQAAIRAGYSAKTANEQAARMLAKVSVQAAVAESQAKLAERTEITQEMVLRRWWEIATADPNELIQLRRTCCRFCHGDDHQYQWTAREYDRALEAWSKRTAAADANKQEPMPETPGGLDYDRTLVPHPDCPECHGEGIETVHAKDTRSLSEQARKLLAGVKVTKDGLEIKMQDQGKALENVARHLGMFTDKLELTGNLKLTHEQFLEQLDDDATRAGATPPA